MAKQIRKDKPFKIWVRLTREQVVENETAARTLARQVRLHRQLAAELKRALKKATS